jgi:hypothetical protein
MSEKLRFINQRELGELRRKQFKKQGEKCAVTGLPYPIKECVFDHKHKLKRDPLGGPDRLGLLRGVICGKVNTFEGKLWRMWKRLGLSEDISLPDLLRNIADYIETPPMKEKVVHPNERPKRKKLNKVEFKRVLKYWFVMNPRKRVLPKYPLDGIETEKWTQWIEEADKWREFDRNKKMDKEQKRLIQKSLNMTTNGG